MALNKKGSYTVEASIVMPILILAMIALISIVMIYAIGENIVFSMCDEVMFSEIESMYIDDPVSLPALTLIRVNSENPGLSYAVVTGYDYRHEEDGMTDLISIEVSGSYNMAGPFSGFFAVRERVRGRAFTGLYKPTPEGDNPAEEDDPEIVYVFPMHGEKYHNRECAFLNPACQQVFLTEKIKKKFGPCAICKSIEAKVGESVYCFFGTGTVYHRGNCSMVDKYYVEIEKKDALAQGYMPCTACGG
ncbi:MAG: hypothetical protein J5928_05695 [Firmicutes bacterium]|nr:hypothetical protein [Bacillota bacterium]